VKHPRCHLATVNVLLSYGMTTSDADVCVDEAGTASCSQAVCIHGLAPQLMWGTARVDQFPARPA
jgi:hypothetical protein